MKKNLIKLNKCLKRKIKTFKQDQRKLLNDFTSSIPMEGNEDEMMEDEGPPR